MIKEVRKGGRMEERDEESEVGGRKNERRKRGQGGDSIQY